MNLIPNTAMTAGTEFETAIYPSKTYCMDANRKCIAGTMDGMEAVRQAVAKVLQTERYMYPVYSGNYGVEIQDKLGMPAALALPEIRRCITEALTWDSRIDAVDDFQFDVKGGEVHVGFTVHSIFGDFEEGTEVRI